MNKQEIFDKVATHLMKQMCQAKHGYFCKYRTEEGLRCAVGCLIPDHLYSPNLEGKKVEKEEFTPILKALGIRPDNVGFLSALQSIHDYSFVSDWRKDLERLALKHHLKQPECLR